MTSPDEPTPLIEVVTDDLLLTIDAVNAGDTSTLASRVADRITEFAMPGVNEYIRTHPTQRKGAAAASSIWGSSVSEYVGVHALLSAALLSWASEQTGLSVGEVLAGARAAKEGGS